MGSPRPPPRPLSPHGGFLRKRYVIPSEHGVWAWWIGPFLIGVAAAGKADADLVLLVIAAFASFFLHQPAGIVVKGLAGRGSKRDVRPALLWVAILGTISLACVLALYLRGHTRFVWLATLGVPFFAFHLWLIAKKAERRKRWVEILGAGILALWAPAAYWVSGGQNYPEPWILWSLCWLHSAATIANVYLRLDQRTWKTVGPRSRRLRAGRSTLLHHGLGLGVAVLYTAAGLAPWLTVLAFVLAFVDAVDTVFRPWPGAMPRRIGFRQLAASTIFTAVMVAAYLLRSSSP